MKIDRDAPAIILPVLLVGPTGQIEIDMVLDTGATFTLVSPELAEGLGYRVANATRHVRLITASDIEQAPIITFAAVETLGVRLLDVDVACHVLPRASRIKGLLGLSFLRATKLILALKDGTLDIEGP